MTLGLVPEILDTVDMVMAVSEKLGMVDPKVVKVRDIKHIIAPPVRANRRCCQGYPSTNGSYVKQYSDGEWVATGWGTIDLDSLAAMLPAN